MSYIINKKKQKIAFKYIQRKSPGIIFIHGLNSDMNGQKSINIQKYAKKNNLSFLSFDCRGHGKSSGAFEDFTITDWKEDILNIIDHIAKGPQILIGSSMGGWLMILAAKARPTRVKGLIGLAAAVDFGSSLFRSLSKKNKIEIKKTGITKYNSNGFSYKLKLNFFIESKKNNILKKPFRYNKPLILIHGLKDEIVSKDMPIKIMGVTSGNNVKVIYTKTSDHRLSKPNDLMVINNAIDNIRSNIN